MLRRAPPVVPWSAPVAASSVSAPPHLTHQRRRFGSYQKAKVEKTYERALLQTSEYLKRFAHPKDMTRREPDLKSRYTYERINARFMPNALKKEIEEQEKKDAAVSGEEGVGEGVLLEALRTTKYEGLINDLDLEPFGKMSVVHGDIFECEADAILVPMVPNFLPYRGFSLEVFDRGGKKLVRDAFYQVKNQYILKEFKRREEKAKQEGQQVDPASHMQLAADVEIGQVFVTASHGVGRSQLLLFCVMPYYWQGGPTDAARRLRYTIKKALSQVTSELPFISTLCLPHIGCGLYGYQPARHTHILMEEVMEALLQVEAESPRYTLEKVIFCDKDANTARALKEALDDLAEQWVPERQLVPYETYHTDKTKRVLEIPAKKFFQEGNRRKEKISFKRHHSVTRRMGVMYRNSIRRFMWRPARCLKPNPFLVHKSTGEPAAPDRQPPPTPFYYRGVTHILFPVPRTGFKSQRVDSKGRIVGDDRIPNMGMEVKPRN
ncbi:unnamed protein product [Vitrella brassicaformis CCMP3155]|uniref:Macro domain-containing protein n=2 Tax=Vitrella brassicaformis TaxID=1169539 RepID=A0A0G4EK44_VITBC|nr:unnamed protein product [Vitrella brassicaformis CCMP3155]|eukprot:CEL96776.1 unnamed protein product [Vitrella brassicaformis CCMP3155]